MKCKMLGLSLALSWVCLGADTGLLTARGENASLTIEADLHRDHKDVAQLLGEEIEEGIVVVAVTVTPKGAPVKLWRDDFFLRSEKDGQRSEPYDPGQIAGDTVLTLSYSQQGGGLQQQESGPVWGGMGGSRPGRLPSTSPGGIGNAGTVEQPNDVEVSNDPDESAKNPLLRRLEELVLKESEISQPVSGLLYFPLEGKHKDKHLWLHYNGGGGRIDLHFVKD